MNTDKANVEEATTSGKKMVPVLVTVVAVVMSLYHILYIGHVFDYLGIYTFVETHRAFHVAFVLALIYLLFNVKSTTQGNTSWYKIALALLSVTMPLYFAFNAQSEIQHWQLVGLSSFELILGIIGLVLLLEATRRVDGLPMTLVAAFFVLYTLYGSYFPGFLQHRGFSINSVINIIMYSDRGIFGFVTGISATIIIMFVLFGEFLLASGAGELFIKLAYALVGKYRGGPAKIAIVASMLFGMISGSTAANIATTGSFTIPLMKKIGYKPAFAGAVEAVASNGGQFTPPVMGAVAFIMAEWLGISYWTVALAAAIPAILYYIALYIFIDIEAMRLQLRGLSPDQLPSLKGVFRLGWIYIIPIATLIYFIAVLNYPVATAALYSIALMVIVSLFTVKAGILPKKIISALKNGATGGLQAYMACIAAQVITSSIMLTGLGPKLTSLLLAMAGQNLFLILAVTALTCFVFGMGMGTIPIYMILVTFVAPALVELGIPPLAAHLFVFWWGLTAQITPPVCPGVFVAGAIAESKIWDTGLIAMRLGVLTYFLPFIWVFQPSLILIGSTLETAAVVTVVFVAIIMLGYGISGFMLKWWQRLLLLGSTGLLLTFNWIFAGAGIAIGIFTLVSYRLARQRLRLPSG